MSEPTPDNTGAEVQVWFPRLPKETGLVEVSHHVSGVCGGQNQTLDPTQTQNSPDCFTSSLMVQMSVCPEAVVSVVGRLHSHLMCAAV